VQESNKYPFLFLSPPAVPAFENNLLSFEVNAFGNFYRPYDDLVPTKLNSL